MFFILKELNAVRMCNTHLFVYQILESKSLNRVYMYAYM